MARKAADVPWPEIDAKSGYNLIRVGREGILLLKGKYFALHAAAFKGCYEPLAKRTPAQRQYFPAPTLAGSERLARKTLALMGLVPGDCWLATCKITGEQIVGYNVDLKALGGAL